MKLVILVPRKTDIYPMIFILIIISVLIMKSICDCRFRNLHFGVCHMFRVKKIALRVISQRCLTDFSIDVDTCIVISKHNRYDRYSYILTWINQRTKLLPRVFIYLSDYACVFTENILSSIKSVCRFGASIICVSLITLWSLFQLILTNAKASGQRQWVRVMI